MAKSASLCLVIQWLTLFSVYAQVPVSYQFDASGYPIDGYLDPFSYQPNNSIIITHRSDSYEKGTVYHLDGSKQEGLIRYENSKVLFKKDDLMDEKKLKPDSLLGLTVGVDSFFVIQNYYFKGVLRKQKQFAQYIAKIEGDVFVKYYKFNNVRLQGTEPITITYLAKKQEENVWYELKGTKLRQHGHKYLGLVQIFNEHLMQGGSEKGSASDWLIELFKSYYEDRGWRNFPEPQKNLKESDIYESIKKLDYLYKYAHNESLYFDSNWNETTKPSEGSRVAKIESIKKGAWEFHYFQEAEKKYEISYSSLFPHEIDGMFRAYTKGSLSKEVSYRDNEPKTASVYRDAKKLYEYFWSPIFNTNGNEIGKEPVFKMIMGKSGEDLLNNSTTLEWQDPITKNKYVHNFKMRKLETSYYVKDARKIYQVANKGQALKLKKLQKSIAANIDTDMLKQTLADNAQGTILVKVLINPAGKVDNYEIFGAIHKEFDLELKLYLEEHLTEYAEFRLGFKPMKVNQKKVYLETYIPVQFSINKFYRASNNNMWFMHHQMMMQQQMMMNTYTPPIPTFSPPSF